MQYIDGVTKIPEAIDSEKVKERRQLERDIRKYKRYVAGTQDPDTAKAYRKKLKEKQHELKLFVDENSSVLRRDYSREKSGPLTDKDKDDIIIREMHDCGLVGKIHLTPKDINTDLLVFDSEHINSRSHDVAFDEAIEYIKNSRFSVSRWGGEFENYYGDDGAVYVNTKIGQIRTSYKRKDFTENVIKALEVLDKYGR